MRNWIAIAAVASAMSVGACQRGPDVERMAEGAIESAALQDQVDVNFDRSAGVVRLSGTVDSASQRERAADVVRASIGTRAEVANEIVVEGAHADAADDLDTGIEERFETLVENSPEIHAGDVDMRVENGVVTLSGTVPTDAERTKLEGLVRSIPGVRETVNSVRVEAAKK
jgi:hyperosmotically inducible protein